MKANPLIGSLRGRLTGWYLVVLVLALGTFSALLYVSLHARLYRHHDAELELEARRLSQGLTIVPSDAATIGEFMGHSAPAGQFVIVRSRTGDVVYQSPLLQVTQPDIGQHHVLVHAASHGASTAEFFTTELEGWGTMRFICLPLDSPVAAYLQVGIPLGEVEATLRSMIGTSLTLIPVVLTLMGVGGWIVAGRALAPMQAIDETLRSIQATDLSRRIQVRGVDEELGRLVASLNQLLGRLEQSFASMKEFAADVSHQLQTPLAVMRSSLEVLSAAPEAPVDSRQTLADVVEEIDEMAAVLADLRTLSLADSGPDGDRPGPVDISKTVFEAAEIVEALAEAKGVALRTSIRPDLTVRGSAVALKQVVLNLADNAVKYTTSGGLVRVDLDAEAHAAVLRVADTGAGIPADQISRVFEPFYRAAQGARSTGGTGLGLAIVKRIVGAHGGSIQVDSQPGEGSTFTVRVPLGV